VHNVGSRIQCVRGNLVEEAVDAIVNAANSTLRGGGGVDGAIHRAAGPELAAECARLYPGGCPTGEVRLTRGFRLKARFVIHAVGPVWRGGGERESELLASCYDGALALAAREELRTVAFPAISCGAYGYPWRAAADVALATIALGLERHAGIELVRMVLLDPDLHAIFERARAELSRAP
jgi:O-acetyl-ADP-ribose deacetylase (regulator of RNase III)